MVVLPRRTEKSGIDSSIIEHKGERIFGLNYEKKNDKYSPKDDTNKAKQSHEIFVEKNLKFTEGMTSDIVVKLHQLIIR